MFNYRSILEFCLRTEANLKAILSKLNSQERWLDSVALKELLHISDSTLYRLKKKNVLNAYRISGKDYYKYSEVHEVLCKHKVQPAYAKR